MPDARDRSLVAGTVHGRRERRCREQARTRDDERLGARATSRRVTGGARSGGSSSCLAGGNVRCGKPAACRLAPNERKERKFPGALVAAETILAPKSRARNSRVRFGSRGIARAAIGEGVDEHSGDRAPLVFARRSPCRAPPLRREVCRSRELAPASS